MTKTIQLKNKKFLYLYWVLLIALGAVALVMTFTVDKVKTGQIVNSICMLAILAVFFGGYFDFKNYLPLNKTAEAFYIATGMIGLACTLYGYNVQNYNSLSSVDVFNDYYNALASAFVSLQLGIGIIGASLAVIKNRDKHFQARVFYAIAISAIISSIVMTIFNFSTEIILFKGFFGIFGFSGIFFDIGLTTLIIRVLLEYSIFIAHSIHKRKHVLHLEGHIRDEVEFEPKMVVLAKIGFWLMLSHVVLLRILRWFSTTYPDYSFALFIAYEVVEIISAVGVIVVGILMCIHCKRNMTYGQIYRRMGLAALIFGAVYLVMDFVPINDIVMPDANEIQSIVILDIFHSIIKILGLVVYTAYVMFNKKLKTQIDFLEQERHETAILA